MIEITPAAYNFLLAEVQAVHKACDRLKIARTNVHGEKLSMAQRVGMLSDHAEKLEETVDALT